MADEDQYCFYSPDFRTHIGITLKELNIKQEFCDVTLLCQDRRVYSHKFLLASSSPIFKNILKKNVNHQPQPLIPLPGVQYKILKKLLKFMYEGEVSIDSGDVDSFFELAENLKIKGLMEGKESNLDSMFDNQKEVKVEMEESNLVDHAIVNNFNNLEYYFEQSYENCELKPKSDKKNLGERRFSCDKCDKKFITKVTLARHIAAIHDGIFFSCDHCGKQFSLEANLWKHKAFVHEGKRYSCELCDYKSTQKEYLRNHIKKVHTVDANGDQEFKHKHKKTKKFTCDKCDKHFTERSVLRRHVQSIHEGLIVSCDQCGKQFNQTANLWVHKQAAHGGIEYSCKHCDYKSTAKNYLTKHMKKHHDIQPLHFLLENGTHTESDTKALGLFGDTFQAPQPGLESKSETISGMWPVQILASIKSTGVDVLSILPITQEADTFQEKI